MNKLSEPRFLQTALQYFFDRATIPVQSGNTVIDFMDYFPLLKQGYAEYHAVNLLSGSYNFTHNLLDPNNANFFIPDDLYVAAFGNNIPAFYYGLSNRIDNPNRFNKTQYIQMQDAVKRGLIPKALNTFEAVQSLNPFFDPQRIYTDSFSDMNILNSQNILDDSTLYPFIDNEQTIATLIDEFDVARAIFQILYNLFEHNPSPKFTIIDMMVMAMTDKDKQKDAFLNRLLADDRINKLIYAIITGDVNLVDQYIDLYDPRDNNFEAYNLAVEQNKPIIVERIKKAIAQRNFLEQQTFQTMMIPLGESDVPESQRFYQYSRYLANK